MPYAIKDILKLEVAPALGCTEPTAVALCTAAAAGLLDGQEINSIEVFLDPNIYKNAMAVSIPGTKGASGIDLAATLGALGGDPALMLEVLDPINDQTLKDARRFIREKSVKIELMPEKQGIYIHTILRTGHDVAEATIEKLHNAITMLKLNGNEIKEHPLLCKSSGGRSELADMEAWLSSLSLDELIAMLDQLDDDDLNYIAEGVTYNLKLANHGLTFGPGLGVGLTFERLVREGLLKKDMILSARILTSAASDARMSGVKLPAMSSAGSGNHGLTAILPIWAIKDYLEIEDETRILKAIALSHLITAYIKAYTGRLSAVCGCSVAAGAGATGGITYLMGGTLQHIANAIKNLIGDLAGVICDGAKAGCSLKLSTAAGTAVQSALFALHGIDIKATDGIVATSSEKTMQNVGALSAQGMIETDRTILNIMINKEFEQIH